MQSVAAEHVPLKLRSTQTSTYFTSICVSRIRTLMAETLGVAAVF